MRQPLHRVAGDLDVGDGARGRPHTVDEGPGLLGLASPSGGLLLPASAAAGARGPGTWPPGPCPGSQRVPGPPSECVPHARTPTPPGPPQDWASPASTEGGGEGTRPGTPGRPRRAVCALRHTSWTSSGWRVPTSPFAYCSGGPNRPRDRHAPLRGLQVDAARPVHRDRATACRSPAAGAVRPGAGRRSARPRAATSAGAAAAARRGGRRPRPTARPRAGRRESDLGRSHPEAGRDTSRAWSSSLRAVLPRRGAARVGPACVDRRQQRLARAGCMGVRPRRAEPRRIRLLRHTSTLAPP